jgi:hypothetical protein
MTFRQYLQQERDRTRFRIYYLGMERWNREAKVLLAEIVTDTYEGVCPGCGCGMDDTHATICAIGKARKFLGIT